MSSTRILRAAGAALTLAALLVGLPVLLWTVAGSPLPTGLPSLDQVVSAVTNPADGRLFLAVIRIVGWVAWATFALAVLAEIPAQLRGRRPPRLPGLRLQQHAARALVAALLGTVAVSGLATPLASATLPTDAPATLSQASISQAQPVQESDESPTQPEETVTQTPTHLVRAGESLWKIAETHLGDGHRWRQIAELNYGRQQPDGRALGTDHWLSPGWTLLLPSDAIGQEQPDSQPSEQHTTHVVQPGQTLWQIAQTHLGDGDEWPRLYEDNRHTVQPDGRTLEDPDLIHPGWQIAIPLTQDSAHEEPPPAQEPAPETDTNAPESSPDTTPLPEADPVQGDAGRQDTPRDVPAVAPPGPATADIPAPHSDAGDGSEGDEDEEDSSAWVRTSGGAGALLAAGIAGLIAIKRARAQATRRPGRRLALPAAHTPTSLVEDHLHAVADPIAWDTVNHALRSLATWNHRNNTPLPDVRAARLTADGTAFHLYLAEPADLPSPWLSTPDRQVWTLAAADIEHLDNDEDAPAPYPSLVTIGHDDEDAHLMLDLERLGQLDIRGQAEAARGTLAALAVELATSQWADDLQVTLVGTLSELPDAIDTGRVRYVSGFEEVADELRARANLAPRSEPGEWAPEILLIGPGLAPDQIATLDELVTAVPRVGIAAVTTDAQFGQWILDLDDHGSAVLSPPQLQVRPQTLTGEEYTQILAVLASAGQTVDGPSWASSLEDVEHDPPLDGLPSPVDTSDTEDEQRSDEEQLTSPTLTVSEAFLDVQAPAEDTHTEDIPQEIPGPLVRVLGEVDIIGINTGDIPTTHESQALELVAYLALEPGQDGVAMSQALWPGSDMKKSTRNSAVSRARRWLGTDDTGAPYLPPSEGGRYTLQGIRSDWDIFRELIGPDITTTPLADLHHALQLVRSRPFDRIRAGRTRVRANRYLWADRWAYNITSAILDTAHELARRALLEGKTTAATRAAEKGLSLCAEDERLWRDAIRAAHLTGDHRKVADLTTGLLNQLTELGVDPAPETNDLLDEINATRRTRAS